MYYKIRYRLGLIKKSMLEIFDYLFFYNTTRKIKKLKNKYVGKRCFVIGNGPSLKKMNLNLMKNDYVICSNSFYLKFNDLDFIPNMITVEDHLVVEDNVKELNELSNITKIFPIDLKKNFYNKDLFFIELRRALCNKKTDGNFKFNSGNEIFYWGGTVLYMNLQIAAYLGFKEIYLIGVDLSYEIPDDALIKGSVITSQSDDPNHFDPTYFGKGKRWHLPETQRMQKSFSNAYFEMKKNGVNLYNATIGGNLQVIPKVNFQSLF